MKYLLIITSFLAYTPGIFSQTVNSVDLNTCLERAVNNHPLNKNKALLESMKETQDLIINKDAYPTLAWKAQAKLQSESIGLEFDNPMIPSIEIPIYSAQSTLDVNYTIYDGGIHNGQKRLNQDVTVLKKQQIDDAIDQVKQKVIQSYLSILFLDQKSKILEHSKERIEDKLGQMKSALKHGIVQKTSVQQLEIKRIELESQIEANEQDRSALLSVLSEYTELEFSETLDMELPSPGNFSINEEIAPKKLASFMLEQQVLESQKEMIDAKNKPKVFAFLTAGTGYPNPLNFFDDQISLFAVGGLGFSWQFMDFGKSKEEKQLLRIQQEMIDTKQEFVETNLNRYNQQFHIQLEKYTSLINTERQLINLKTEIANIEEKKLEKGIILPLEYLNNLDEIIDSELKLRQYELELVKIKLEYLNLKGKL